MDLSQSLLCLLSLQRYRLHRLLLDEDEWLFEHWDLDHSWNAFGIVWGNALLMLILWKCPWVDAVRWCLRQLLQTDLDFHFWLCQSDAIDLFKHLRNQDLDKLSLQNNTLQLLKPFGLSDWCEHLFWNVFLHLMIWHMTNDFDTELIVLETDSEMTLA